MKLFLKKAESAIIKDISKKNLLTYLPCLGIDNWLAMEQMDQNDQNKKINNLITCGSQQSFYQLKKIYDKKALL